MASVDRPNSPAAPNVNGGANHEEIGNGETPIASLAVDDRVDAARVLANAGAKLDLASAVQLGWAEEVAKILKGHPELARMRRRCRCQRSQ